MKINEYVQVKKLSKEALLRGHKGIIIKNLIADVYIRDYEIKKLIKILKHFDKKLNK